MKYDESKTAVDTSINGSEHSSLLDNGGEGEASGCCSTWTTLTKVLLGAGILTVLIVALVLVKWNGNGGDPAETSTLTLQFIRDNETFHCMDGSPAGYYTRKTASHDFIIFLEYGGSFCWDQETCDTRSSQFSNDVTSTVWEATKDESGFLSLDQEENPYFYAHNVISIPYCSSDYWLGNAGPAQSGTSYYFQGAAIIQEVMRELLEDDVFAGAESISIWGQGAGGFGVLTQADNIKDYLAPLGPTVSITSVMDSAWAANADHYMEMPCTSASDCQLDITLPYLVDTVNPIYPQRCIDAGLTWECALAGLSALSEIVVPIAVFQWQYEVSQLSANGVMSIDDDTRDWCDSVADLRLDEFAELPVGSSYYYPSCYDHEIATKDYIEVRGVIGDNTLLASIYEWMHGDGAPFLTTDTCGESDCNPTCGVSL